MKKLVVLAASILLYTLAQAQEGSNSGTSAGITIIPRVDVNPTFYDGKFDEVTLGNSSLYSLFEGNITENLSFSVCNHWLSSEPKYLYQNTGRTDDVNWCDWAYLEYNPGNFIITAGKHVITFGGFELEEYDFDVHLDMMTGLFNNFQCYQWGGKVGWMNDSESTGLFLQATSSPYGEKPFDAMAYSFQYQGYYGPFSMLYSTNFIEDWDGEYQWMFTLGNQLELDSWTLQLDVSNKVGDPMFILRDGITAFTTAKFNPSDKWEFVGRCGYEKATTDMYDLAPGLYDLIPGLSDVYPKFDSWTFGAAAHCFPLRDSQNLRLHAAAAYNTFTKMTSLTLGAMYYIHIPRNR
ncbi:MAG: hypothetical protein J6N80_06235 [Bacteroidales bacterium]|nr:hypothetical protein [Bacteroidales bacterium]